jgi:hypothetical protein
MKILLRKINKTRNEEYFAWTKLYNNIDDLIQAIIKSKDCLINKDIKIIIEGISENEE